MTVDMRDAFFETLVHFARQDERIVLLSADHGAFALREFETSMPERFVNVGIAEQNMIGVAAGLASSGKIVFAYGISPFVSLRVLEQLTLDVAAMQLPVSIVSVGAGFTYSTDGPTHHGLQELPAVMTIPGLTVLNSSDPHNTGAFVEFAINSKRANYIRIEKGVLPNLKLDSEFSVETGFSVVKKSGRVLFISTGAIVHELLEVLPAIEQGIGQQVSVIDLFRPSSVYGDDFLALLSNASKIYTLEESYSNGIGQLVGSLVATNCLKIPFKMIAPESKFYYISGDRRLLRKIGKVDSASILQTVIQDH
ncbi:MAG: transketolase C-terminal domain-containing protein [Candidatus Sericytochromatia bacterium]|nr:transketolase C-terminal domain-containing protein [Candidatus Sericytochromatia bacterium]